jgi:hypothetical protein
MMPADGLAQIRYHDAILLGAVGWPGVPPRLTLGIADPDPPPVSPVRQPPPDQGGPLWSSTRTTPIEADHGRLKARTRPMRGLTRVRSAQLVCSRHAFVQNLRRGHYDLGFDAEAAGSRQASSNSPVPSEQRLHSEQSACSFPTQQRPFNPSGPLLSSCPGDQKSRCLRRWRRPRGFPRFLCRGLRVRSRDGGPSPWPHLADQPHGSGPHPSTRDGEPSTAVGD